VPCSAKKAFPSLIRDPASKTLSLIVPAYNESIRMDPMMDPTQKLLSEKAKKDKCVVNINI
jgi:hypothetical protein